jgi:hypothetical protein
MEQDDAVTSSDDAPVQRSPFAFPSAASRLRERLRVLNLPLQNSAASSSEQAFYDSLDHDEEPFVDRLLRAWFINSDAIIDRTTGIPHDVDVVRWDAQHAEISPTRWRWIQNRVYSIVRDAIEEQNKTELKQFRAELGAVVKKFKRHETDTQHTRTHYSFDFKQACNLIFKKQKYTTVTKKQARKATYAIAYKFKLHSGEQLWRIVYTDHTLQLLDNLQFA